MIILLLGENGYLSRRKLVEYKKRYQKKYGSRGNLVDFDCEENNDIDWEASIKSESLFTPVSLVIYRKALEKLPAENQEMVCKLFNNNKDVFTARDLVLIFWEDKMPKKSGFLFKLLSKKATVENYPKLEGQKLKSFLRQRLKELSPEVTISTEALDKLISYTAGDSDLLENELNKLASFRENGEITPPDIELLVSAALTSTIFNTIEAASSGNKKLAIRLLHEQLINREDPFYILSMYVYQFRNLLKISELYWKGITNNFEIAKRTRVHPYVVQKTIPQIKNFTPEKLQIIYSKLQNIDWDVKTGSADIVLAIDKFLIGI